MFSQQPIGIYDSGIGGLTVANAIATILPHEHIIYFGDTAHLPYGDKSPTAIRSYSDSIVALLIEKKCKVIVIACHSASSSCYESSKKWEHNGLRVINAVDPLIDIIQDRFQNKKIGLIGTKRTIQSGMYEERINGLSPPMKLKSLATPLLAPMIEEGFFNNQISNNIINQYLSDPQIAPIDCLILACTHYRLIKKEISAFYNHNIPILDAAEAIASAVAHHIHSTGILNSTSSQSSKQFYISDYTPSFEAAAKLFFGQAIRLEEQHL